MNDLNDHIEKYLRGELSSEEMHKLEKQALHDPFLADALEGAQQISQEDFAKDISELKSKMIKSERNKWIWPIRIAASIVLLVSVTYLIFNLNPGQDQELAMTENSSKQSDSEKEVLEFDTDSSTATTNNKNEEAPKIENNQTSGARPSQIDPITKPSEVTSGSGLIASNDLTDKTSDKKDSDTQLPEKITELTEESELAFSIAEESKSVEDISTSGTEPVKESIAPRTQARASELRSKKSAEIVDIKLPQPELTEGTYQDYLRSHVKYPTSAVDNNIQGEVIISFTVDRKGQLTNFKIVKSIGYGCDEELIRLIKEGPAWTPAQSNNQPIDHQASISYNFVSPER